MSLTKRLSNTCSYS